ncbi:LuxR family transcriptional regulator [Nonomuraea africana]|uniref:DNA-binding CsgD family transcriptional regulator n=1 Tax=Nonomuraea africana TaxID=46171 RepID=A0ABR9KAM0_9ACTN|nr:LuxR family transcriptional regulator [Nonomuraea africana]MBE1559064.1 DNA-binding CsgD family transcriptional regulator [Nonomuraea africana]
MASTWPFAGRSGDIQAAGTHLGDPASAGVLIAGPMGAGKTRLMAELLRQHHSRAAFVARAGACAAAAALPFGALAHLIPPEVPPSAEANLIGWAARILLRAAGRRRLLLAVDDAHLLDSASAALIQHLVSLHAARLLATLREGEAVPSAITGLWTRGLLRRLDLGPLPQEAVHEILEAALGGQVDTAASSRLHRLAAGNPLYLRELVEAGALAKANGVWRWIGRLPPAVRLGELVEARIGALTSDEQAVVELVALGEPLGAELVAGLVSAEALESAEAKGLVEAGHDGRRVLVRLAHPLYGEVVRARLPALRRRRRLRELADATERYGTRRGQDVLQVAAWRLDSGGGHDARTLVTACRLAQAAHEVELAIRFGQAALDAGAGAEAAAPLARGLIMAGRAEEAAHALASVAEPSGDELLRARVAQLRLMTVNFGLDRPDEADRMFAPALAGISDVELRAEVIGQQTYNLAMRGSCTQAMELLRLTESTPAGPRPPGPAPHSSGLGEVLLLEAKATALGQLGRCAEAVEACRRLLDATDLWRADAPELMLTLTYTRHLARVLDGDLASEEIGAALAQAAEADGWGVAHAVLTACLAQLHRLSGKVKTARRLAHEAYARLAATPYAILCLGEVAHAAALSGEPEAARAALESPAAASLGLMGLWREPARAWLAALEGGPAADLAAELAAEARGRGLLGLEMVTLHDVVRLAPPGSPPVVAAAARLAEVAARHSGRLAPIAAEHAHASAATDGPALVAVGERFAGLGLLLHAAEAMAQAGRVLAAKPVEARAWALAARCEAAGTPALAGLRAPGLTDRERDIALLAASGLRNKEIAERLSVSPRTVANHLQSAYAKLGIGRRTEIAAALDLTG